MARRNQYDDAPLLEIMAEILAFPQYTGVHTRDEAMRQAIGYIEGSNQWPPDKHERVVGRLKKSYAKCGAQLEAKARQLRRLYPGPLLPPSLLSKPTDPATAHAMAETRDLVEGLRFVANWAAGLASIMERQRWRGEGVNADLVAHARTLVRLVEKEKEAEMQRAARTEKNGDH